MKYHVNAIIDDDFWQVVKHEKMQEGDFEVESSMGFDGSHWCQLTLDLEHRTTNVNQNRSTASPEHRSMTPTESSASCNTVRIMTHEDFTVRHPHPPSPVYVNIDRQTNPALDRQPPSPIDRRTPLTYRVQFPRIDVARLNALMPQPKPLANPPETTSNIQKMQLSLWKLIRILWGEP